MTPGTIKTILNTAPIIIQGASKLVKLIRDRDADNENTDLPATLDGLKQQMEKIELRLDANDKSSLAEIKLIEELARQYALCSLALGKRNQAQRQALDNNEIELLHCSLCGAWLRPHVLWFDEYCTVIN